MKKEIFNQIVVDNIDSTLVSVILNNGMRISQELEIEGNRTTRTNVTFIKIEDSYVGIRKHSDVTYDYSGQISKGDSRNSDFYLGYEEIVALEFFDEVAKPIYGHEVPGVDQQRHEIIQKENRRYTGKVKNNPEDELFIPTAGDI